MMIPTRVCKAVPMVAGPPSRYALNYCEARRDRDGRARLTATDGKRLLTVVWADAHDTVPATLGDGAPVKGFRALLPADGVAQAARLLPAGKARKAGRILCEEPTAKGMARLAAMDGDAVPALAVRTAEGQFPEWDAVVRAPVTDASRRIRLDVRMLRDTLQALEALGVATVDIDTVDPASSVRLTPGGWEDDCADRPEVVAVLMPVIVAQGATVAGAAANRWHKRAR